MDIESYIQEAIFGENEQHTCFYQLIWDTFNEVNETGFEDVIDYIQTLGYGDEDILNYCKSDPEIEVDENDFDLTVKNALDYITEITADKMLDEFSADDLFDLMFTASYAFEQDFTFDFEDYDEMQAFIDTNHDQLDNYKEEYPSVMNWIEAGMIC